MVYVVHPLVETVVNVVGRIVNIKTVLDESVSQRVRIENLHLLLSQKLAVRMCKSTYLL